MPMCRRFVSAALVVLLASIGAAQAAVVCSPAVNLDVPATGEGLYVNLITSVSAPTESGAPGFDFDPYASQASNPAGQLKFYWGSAANGGAGVVSSGAIYALLQPGDVIGPGSSFSREGFTGNTDIWQAGQSNAYLGLRFKNEGSGVINYGWIRMSTTQPRGFPLTIHNWCYDDAGINVGIPGPQTDPIFADGFELAG